MAPEQTGTKVYSKPVDIWSCGLVMFILITGKHPLFNEDDTYTSYLDKLENLKWNFPSDFSESAKHLFSKLTHSNPLERYTAEQALKHPWITGENSKPPLTYLEKLTQFNDKLKLRRILQALIVPSTLKLNLGLSLDSAYNDKIKDPNYIALKIETKELEMPKIALAFSVNDKRNYRRFNSLKINRNPSPIRSISPPKKGRIERTKTRLL